LWGGLGKKKKNLEIRRRVLGQKEVYPLRKKITNGQSKVFSIPSEKTKTRV